MKFSLCSCWMNAVHHFKGCAGNSALLEYSSLFLWQFLCRLVSVFSPKQCSLSQPIRTGLWSLHAELMHLLNKNAYSAFSQLLLLRRVIFLMKLGVWLPPCRVSLSGLFPWDRLCHIAQENINPAFSCCISLSLSLKLSYVMSGYRCFTCPVEFNNDTNSFTVDCEPSELFQLQEYKIPLVLQSVVGWVGLSVYWILFIGIGKLRDQGFILMVFEGMW